MDGKEYRALRMMLGLSQAELADVVGVHVQTVKAREAGRTPVRKEAELSIVFLHTKQGGVSCAQ